MNREQLIEKAAKAGAVAMRGVTAHVGLRDREFAAAALAVFEEAHAPTDRELRTLRNVVKDYDANFPCDGGCNTNDGPEETCSRHGRSPRDLWDLLDAARRAAHAPTDDEREALARWLHRRFATNQVAHWELLPAHLKTAWRDMAGDAPAGFRRTVQGEPTDAIPDDDQIAADNADWHTEYTEPQGEASDVQVDAALRAYYKEPRGDWVNQFAPNMRAALRAAAEAEGGNRG